MYRKSLFVLFAATLMTFSANDSAEAQNLRTRLQKVEARIVNVVQKTANRSDQVIAIVKNESICAIKKNRARLRQAGARISSRTTSMRARLRNRLNKWRR